MRGFFFRKCDRCSGTSIAPGHESPEDPCTQCGGVGSYSVSQLEPDIVFACGISDALDIGEYNALSDGNKAALHIILSLGFVNLAEGTNSKLALWAMFDENSTTRVNLLTLLAEAQNG